LTTRIRDSSSRFADGRTRPVALRRSRENFDHRDVTLARDALASFQDATRTLTSCQRTNALLGRSMRYGAVGRQMPPSSQTVPLAGSASPFGVAPSRGRKIRGPRRAVNAAGATFREKFRPRSSFVHEAFPRHGGQQVNTPLRRSAVGNLRWAAAVRSIACGGSCSPAARCASPFLQAASSAADRPACY
jgi:hypothetical protein